MPRLTPLFVAALSIAWTSAGSIANPTTQPADAYPLTPDGHGGSLDATTRPVSSYPLKTDVVSGEPLGDHPVIEQIDGREVHFANAETAVKFKAGGEEMQKKMDAAIIAVQKDHYTVKTCLVSDEDLGDMGDVVMYVHRPTNQLVEFCCGGCVKKFKKEPEKYLGKLKAEG